MQSFCSLIARDSSVFMQLQMIRLNDIGIGAAHRTRPGRVYILESHQGASAGDVGTHDRRRTKKKRHLTKESNNKLNSLSINL